MDIAFSPTLLKHKIKLFKLYQITRNFRDFIRWVADNDFSIEQLKEIETVFSQLSSPLLAHLEEFQQLANELRKFKLLMTDQRLLWKYPLREEKTDG